MVRSMTGYARGAASLAPWRVSAEIRSVNGRFAEVRVRTPEGRGDLEPALRRRVLERVRRGRVDLDLRVTREEGPSRPLALDIDAAREVLDAVRRLGSELRVAGEVDVATIVRMPGVLRAAPEEVPGETLAEAAAEAVDRALEGLETERAREGEVLRVDLVARFDRMAALAGEIRSRATAVPAAIRDRLTERVTALLGEAPLDPGRVAQEVAFLADRADVTEEIVRLEGHLGQARRLVESPDGEPVGKRLDFLIQEIHRETNTVGSKSPDLELTRAVLELKSETEKVREQVQNLE